MNAAKPFVCPAIGCNQQFANEDHLEVHRRKHEMSLGLRDFKSSLDTPVIADQTPTPTRFLKNCEEVGLFSDLPNPFDESFREASKFHHTEPESNNNANLEQNDTDKTTISDDDDDDIDDDDDMDANSPSDDATVGDTSSTTITASPQAVSSTTEEEAAHIAETLHPQVITTTAPSAIPLTITKTVHVQKLLQQPQVIQQHQQIISVQPQAIAAATNGQSVLTQVAVQGAVSGAMVVPTMSAPSILTAAGSDVKVSLANVHMPFMNTIPISAPILLRLPNGQTIPVVPPSVANPAVHIPLAVSAMEPQTTQASDVAQNDSNVKMKLKNALLTSQSQGNMGVMTQAVEVVTRQQQAVTSTSIALPPKSEITVMQLSPG